MHAINRLGSAPRSGMGASSQLRKREKRTPDGVDTEQRPPLPTRTHRIRLTLLSGYNTITKRAAERFGHCPCVPVCILHPCAQSCPWSERGQTKHARLPQREPGPGSQQRQHLISHACPEASFSTRAADCSSPSSLRPHLFAHPPVAHCVYFDCLLRLRWPSPLPHLLRSLV
ncbi:hypothetical protein SVAN01_02929 [Stagonosporopsis vannaccii]|nr:hypothetical protein SVAN01_02929 [Stagonosporopsis vannaccii]